MLMLILELVVTLTLDLDGMLDPLRFRFTEGSDSMELELYEKNSTFSFIKTKLNFWNRL